MKIFAVALIALTSSSQALRMKKEWQNYPGMDPDHVDRVKMDERDAPEIAEYKHIGAEKIRTVWHYDEGYEHRCTYYSCK